SFSMTHCAFPLPVCVAVHPAGAPGFKSSKLTTVPAAINRLPKATVEIAAINIFMTASNSMRRFTELVEYNAKSDRANHLLDVTLVASRVNVVDLVTKARTYLVKILQNGHRGTCLHIEN